MLRELLSFWLDRGSRFARRFGYDRDAVCIAARHRRCREAWAPHLEAARTLILESAATACGRETAVILGSGLCLDVPVAELCARFHRVFLVDAHHPRSSRKLAGKFPNARLVAADVTGMTLAVERAVAKGSPLPSPAPVPDPLPGVVADFTASVNLASQLPLPFYKVLGARVPEAVLGGFCRALIEAHFDWLGNLPGRTCLLCDKAWQRFDGGRLIESQDALEGAALPGPDRVWTWRIAPSPEESFAYDRHNLVWGYRDFSAAQKA